jgi:hypothetical protein
VGLVTTTAAATTPENIKAFARVVLDDESDRPLLRVWRVGLPLVELQGPPLVPWPDITAPHHLAAVLHEDRIEAWLDGALVATWPYDVPSLLGTHAAPGGDANTDGWAGPTEALFEELTLFEGTPFQASPVGADAGIGSAGAFVPLWIEALDTQAGSASVWARVPFVEAGETQTLLVYGDNAAATTASDPAAVFDLYDPFDGDAVDPSLWRVEAGSPKVQSGALVLSTADVQSGGDNNNHMHVRSWAGFGSGFVCETATKNTPDWRSWVGFEERDRPLAEGDPAENGNADCGAFFDMYQGANTWYARFVNHGTGGDLFDSVGGASGASFQKLAVAVESDRTTWWVDGQKKKEAPKAPPHRMQVLTGVRADSSHVLSHDWIRVRRYVTPEPTASASALP